MTELLEPPAQPQAKKGFFNAQNAREYALKSHAVRRLREQFSAPEQPKEQTADSNPNFRLSRVLNQIDALDEQLAGCKDAKTWDMLTRAKERLFKAWVHLAGIPGPGHRKPAPDRPARASTTQLPPPSVPAPTTCSVQPVVQSNPETTSPEVTPGQQVT